LQYLGIALVHCAFGAGWAIFVMSAFFIAIPTELTDPARVDTSLKRTAAGTIMAILPPLALFAALNRYYVRGLFAGSVKG
jgi:multiple sugar transport system permease protein/alpha-glucoside transport system permease protein